MAKNLQHEVRLINNPHQANKTGSKQAAGK